MRSNFTSANMRKGMAKIGARVIEITGELILEAGAKLSAKYENGVEAFAVQKAWYGDIPVGQVLIKRFNGSPAMEVFGGSDEPGFFAIYDQENNIILSDDAVSKKGLARPYIPYEVFRIPDLTSPADLTTSSTFVPHHGIINQQQHPKIRVLVYVHCNGSDVAQVRLRDASTVIATSPNLSGDQWYYLEGSHVGYEFGKEFQYDIEIRRVSGTSSGVGFTPIYAMGIQS
ncbi:hypothetical protein KBX03_22705 [Micromonospora sp. C72]|uniref:hypothetical protein n=1 Tax=Micromonospora sp. C72 TaxID=2824880 RepID=UPI001B361907|nr:hypothetical protein [Micromonospora sp. C72]MBQ1045324.1 hypothetical protein [Micromonospora sp. C72]